MYAYLYEELVPVLGREDTAALMKRAIYRRGLEVAASTATPRKKATWLRSHHLLRRVTVRRRSVRSGVEERSDGRIVLRMTSCRSSRVEGSRPAGRGDRYAVRDRGCGRRGTFDGAGLDLNFLSRLGAAMRSACWTCACRPTSDALVRFLTYNIRTRGYDGWSPTSGSPP